MRLFIDGYNVIFARSAHEFCAERAESAREQLISLLSAYRAVTQEAITVVFDGSRAGRMYPQTQNLHGITVVFSEADADADAVLKRLLAKESNPKAATVVSSDRSVRTFAERLKARCIGSSKFLAHVDRTLKSARTKRDDAGPIEKYQGLPPEQVDYWMEVLGLNKKAPKR